MSFIYSPACLECMLPLSPCVSAVKSRGLKPTWLVKIYSHYPAVHVPHFVQYQQDQHFRGSSLCGCCSQGCYRGCLGLPSGDGRLGGQSLELLQGGTSSFLQLYLLPAVCVPKHFPLFAISDQCQQHFPVLLSLGLLVCGPAAPGHQRAEAGSTWALAGLCKRASDRRRDAQLSLKQKTVCQNPSLLFLTAPVCLWGLLSDRMGSPYPQSSLFFLHSWCSHSHGVTDTYFGWSAPGLLLSGVPQWKTWFAGALHITRPYDCSF